MVRGREHNIELTPIRFWGKDMFSPSGGHVCGLLMFEPEGTLSMIFWLGGLAATIHCKTFCGEESLFSNCPLLETCQDVWRAEGGHKEEYVSCAFEDEFEEEEGRF